MGTLWGNIPNILTHTASLNFKVSQQQNPQDLLNIVHFKQITRHEKPWYGIAFRSHENTYRDKVCSLRVAQVYQLYTNLVVLFSCVVLQNSFQFSYAATELNILLSALDDCLNC